MGLSEGEQEEIPGLLAQAQGCGSFGDALTVGRGKLFDANLYPRRVRRFYQPGFMRGLDIDLEVAADGGDTQERGGGAADGDANSGQLTR